MENLIHRHGLFAAKVAVFVVFPILAWMGILWAGCRLLECMKLI